MQNNERTAFARGFMAGFSTPYRFALSFKWRPSYRVSDTVGSAWSEVGKLLADELSNEGLRQRESRANQEKRSNTRLAS